MGPWIVLGHFSPSVHVKDFRLFFFPFCEWGQKVTWCWRDGCSSYDHRASYGLWAPAFVQLTRAEWANAMHRESMHQACGIASCGLETPTSPNCDRPDPRPAPERKRKAPAVAAMPVWSQALRWWRGKARHSGTSRQQRRRYAVLVPRSGINNIHKVHHVFFRCGRQSKKVETGGKATVQTEQTCACDTCIPGDCGDGGVRSVAAACHVGEPPPACSLLARFSTQDRARCRIESGVTRNVPCTMYVGWM
jgi:hypothetical protein